MGYDMLFQYMYGLCNDHHITITIIFIPLAIYHIFSLVTFKIPLEIDKELLSTTVISSAEYVIFVGAIGI